MADCARDGELKPGLWSTGGGRPYVSQRRGLRWRPLLPFLVVAVFGTGVWLAGDDAAWFGFMPHDDSHQAMPWKLELQPQESAAVMPQGPEQMVRQIYQHLGDGQRQQALWLAEHLAETYPTFQLGQLLYADLLNIGLREPVEGPEVPQEALPAAQKRLQELLTETTRRLLHPPVTGIKGKVPVGLIHLDPMHHPYVAAVDASHSRLYWFANRSDDKGMPRLELLMDTYVSVGSKGLGKAQEGDGRTPVGVYFIQKNLPGETLPDLFGAGALTLNYPNAVDLMRKRTGSGIWLHGTPSAQYSRAPEATDGCVVLSNPEMTHLLGLGTLRLTPVLIGRELQWQAPDKAEAEHSEWLARLQTWNQARLRDDELSLREHYSPNFERDGYGLDHWWGKLRTSGRHRKAGKPLELLSALRWQDGEDVMVVTWLDPNRSTSRRSEYLRTYWVRDANQWKIVFEGPV